MRSFNVDEFKTIVKEKALLKYLIHSKILPFIPVSAKLSKQAKSGLIKTTLSSYDLHEMSLNTYYSLGDDYPFIMEFINTLENELPHCNTSSFYENIETLKIEHNSTSIDSPGDFGYLKNRIRLKDTSKNNNDRKSILTHELLHMASTKATKLFRETGFTKAIRVRKHLLINQKVNREVIGSGLTEGYTEILNKRCFKRYITKDRREIYSPLQFIAYGVEQIVGQKEMEKAYFSNDLDFVINSIGKYIGKDKAEELLIDKTDEILIRYKDNDLSYLDDVRKIKIVLANILLQQAKEALKEGKITQEEFVYKVYDLELYINGYIKNEFFNTKANESHLIITPIPKPAKYDAFEIIDKETYKNLAYEYFESKKADLTFTSTPWRNKKDKTTVYIIEELYENYFNRKNEVNKMLDETSPQNENNDVKTI